MQPHGAPSDYNPGAPRNTHNLTARNAPLSGSRMIWGCPRLSTEKLESDDWIALTPRTTSTQALNDPYHNRRNGESAPRRRQHCRVAFLPGTLRPYH